MFLRMFSLCTVLSSVCWATNPASIQYVQTYAEPASTTYSIGQYAQGGIVFWLTPDREHGLVVAIEDQSNGVAWATGASAGSVASGSDSLSIGYGTSAGKLNAEVILNRSGITSSAAALCASYEGGGYTDWYLPNLVELTAIYVQASVIDAACVALGGSALTATNYWSSVQVFGGSTSYINLSTGAQASGSVSNTFYVRAVRVF